MIQSKKEYLLNLQGRIKNSLFIQEPQESQLLEILPALSDVDLHGIEQMLAAADKKEEQLMKTALPNETEIEKFHKYYLDSESKIVKNEEQKSLKNIEQEIKDL